MKPKAPSELINKYLKGECSQEEEERLYKWYNSFDIHPEPTSFISEMDKVQLRQRMFEQVKQATGIESGSSERKTQVFSLYRMSAAIAAMLLLALSVTFYLRHHTVQRGPSVLPENVSVRNLTDKLSKHVFPDGSIAWMRPHTHIVYKRNFNVSPTRNVSMDGEAFFEVTKNPTHPFIIKTGEVYTRVLGTSFNVRSTPDTKLTEVSVVTGKVMVYTLTGKQNKVKQAAYLIPKEKVLASVAKAKFEKRAETSSVMNIWQKRNLSFDNTPVEEVVRALNQRFDVKIQIKDPIINQYQLKADFSDVNLPSVLELLSKSLGITYEINDNGITMSRSDEN